MNDDRRLGVLRAIVTEYVHTREPVGSKVIAQSHDLGVSSATIRNDMALLEEAGLIYQPHTSAGRVPTDKGYRLFVDSLSALKPMSGPERSAVEHFLEDSLNLDDVVVRTVRLLAQVTHQVAVVEYPTLTLQTLKRVEIVDLAATNVLVIVVTDSGRVSQDTIELRTQLSSGDIAVLREKLNAVFSALGPDEILGSVEALKALLETRLHDVADVLAQSIAHLLRPSGESKIVMAGMSNLARGALDFHDIAPVLDALEEQVVLMRLFSELQLDDDVYVSIGAENEHDALAEASVVASTYHASARSGDTRAHLGIVGPTRMDYARTMASVRAVAAYLSRYLNR